MLMRAHKHQNILKIDKNCLRHLSKYFHSSHAKWQNFKILKKSREFRSSFSINRYLRQSVKFLFSFLGLSNPCLVKLKYNFMFNAFIVLFLYLLIFGYKCLSNVHVFDDKGKSTSSQIKIQQAIWRLPTFRMLLVFNRSEW